MKLSDCSSTLISELNAIREEAKFFDAVKNEWVYCFKTTYSLLQHLTRDQSGCWAYDHRAKQFDMLSEASKNEILNLRQKLALEKQVKAMNKQNENVIESLEHTMITMTEAKALIKPVGCPVFMDSCIKVQEWCDASQTRYWIKAKHTITKIKCLKTVIDNRETLYSKEDIEKALSNISAYLMKQAEKEIDKVLEVLG